MPSGILLLDKPRGLTSNAALQRVRALLSRPKAGHVGSLDPLATGMLPLCLGEATKIAGEILAARKRYRFTLSLGERTATGDAEGAVTASAPVPPLERGAVEAVAAMRARGAWPALLPPDWPLAHLAAVRLEADEARRLLQGQSVPAQVPEAPARVRLYDDSGVFLGLGEADGRAVRPRRLLNPGI